MKLYIRLEDGKPAGSPTSKNKTGYVEYTPYTQEFDDDQMQLIDTYDSSSNSVKQSVIERPDKTAQVLKRVREKRNKLLADSDWTRLDDVYMNAGVKTKWEDYRKQLRDITENIDLDNVAWPTPPG